MDWQKSNFDEFPDFLTEDAPKLAEMPETIYELILNENYIGKRSIFRIVEQPVAVFCSEAFETLR